MSGPAICCADVTLGYGPHPAVHHLDGDIERGSLTAILGPNGAGKSTLLKAIAGELKPLAGSFDFGPDRPRIAYLPQLSDIERSFPISVFELLAMGLWRKAGLFGGFTAEDRRAIEHALLAVGLVGFENRTLDTLSGGQMSRVLFARVMLQNADIILLDEPFAAIDTRTVVDLVALIERWHAEGRTILTVLHDEGLARAHFPTTLLLAREMIAWGPTQEVLTEANLRAARRMVEAHDPHAPLCEVA